MKMKKILAVTGIRSEYDLISPILNEIEGHPNFELKLAVGGAHLTSLHNRSIQNIKEDNFEIVEKIDYLLSRKNDPSRSKGIGILISSLTQTIERVQPDIILVAGDREEPLAASIIGNYMKIPVAHLFGGDLVYGNADDTVRHSISKLAHIHFTICEDHKENLRKMGEKEYRIFNVGNPGLDSLRNKERLDRKELGNLLNMDIHKKNFITLIKHPLSSEVDKSYEHMKTVMKVIDEINIKTLIIYPNSDPGSDEIIEVIENYRNLENVKIRKNLNRLEMANVLRHSACLVGNSSCGFLEAPFFNLPVLNIGNRQKGRINAGNVIFVDHDEEKIKEKIKKIVFNEEFRQNIENKIDDEFYGNGHTGKNVVEILSEINIDDELLIKKYFDS